MNKQNTAVDHRLHYKKTLASLMREQSASVDGLTLPEQFYAPASSSHGHWTGARGLMLGVLHEALATWFRYRKADTARGQRLFEETREWFWSSDRDWLYAFENICVHLELDPDYIRNRLAHPRVQRGTPQMPVVRRQASYSSAGREVLAA